MKNLITSLIVFLPLLCSAQGLEHKLTVIVLDRNTKEPLDEVSVKVYSQAGGVIELSTDSDGMMILEPCNVSSPCLIEDEKYIVVVGGEQSGYLKGQDTLTTIGLKASSHFIKEFLLQPSLHSSPVFRFDTSGTFLSDSATFERLLTVWT